VLETPARPRGTRKDRAVEREADREDTRRGVVAPSYRRDLPEDFLDFERMPFDNAQSPAPGRRRRSLRLRLARLLPRSWFGKAFLGFGVVAGVIAVALAGYEARMALLHDARFAIPNSEAIEIAGNTHLSRAQLLSIFGDDVDRNLWKVPLEERRAELEALPWVEHATVMRLLPNRLRVAVTERTPVAFVEDGGHIGLVDGSGVLLEFQPGQTMKDYSFPVVIGISAHDPLSTRVARMKLYLRFTQELDAGAVKGQEPSRQISDVDLTDPEDVTATYDDSGRSILIHFGDQDFLKHWRNFQQYLPDWLRQYPKLGSVDVRDDRNVVLRMATPIADAKPAAPPAVPSPSPSPKATAPKPVAGRPHPGRRASTIKAPTKAKSKPKSAVVKTQRKGARP